jgi:ribonucleoside-diphosphate reductase alpha chain
MSFYAISASVDLAGERGAYGSFEGSLWSKGILPMDSLSTLHESRQSPVDVDTSRTMDWDGLRKRVMTTGMRNSNCMAIAPTATISNIVGVSPSIEPYYSQLYVKANMSGNFTIMNGALVHDLKARGLWDKVMVEDLKYYDGKVSSITRIPQDLKELYATAFEIDMAWLIRAAARRQKWIDQSQSLNLYIGEPSGRKLDEMYRLAWRLGLKTTYYLRSLSKSHVEKSTLRGTDEKLNAVSSTLPPSCSIGMADCEACQ